MVNTILKEADLFCPNSVRINFTIYHIVKNTDSLKKETKRKRKWWNLW
ncbi:ABC transporter ATP-binding protein [Lactobacillus reuteri]|nr:ABC transporter ATP-binding protein [Lactiplantibacillus plantarum]MQB58153.1 ABC transporter ATP-binding protein [Limosilactobacillus reuteri]